MIKFITEKPKDNLYLKRKSCLFQINYINKFLKVCQYVIPKYFKTTL